MKTGRAIKSGWGRAMAAWVVAWGVWGAAWAGAEPARDERGWRYAVPGWEFRFPADHGWHPEFKTEWWYFTGDLRSRETGERFGFQATFFRQGVGDRAGATFGRFGVKHLAFAHAAMTDLGGRRFVHAGRMSRGAFGEAGFGASDRLAWIEGWELVRRPDGTFGVKVADGDHGFDLVLAGVKPPVVHGAGGVSEKAKGEKGEPLIGRASHYYSLPRMSVSGTLTRAGVPLAVEGEAWFDHEWATNQLGPGQIGWNWMGLRLADGRELMVYEMRRADGQRDLASGGTLVAADGSGEGFGSGDFTLEPVRRWEGYPVEWRLRVPRHGLDLEVEAVLDGQEVHQPPVAYWEGWVEVRGSVGGSGYLEMTGYRKPFGALGAGGR